MKNRQIKKLCAQRLTASKVWAAKKDPTAPSEQHGAQRLTASKVWAGYPRCAAASRIAVLNALRHLRFGQGNYQPPMTRRTSAQRLTASKVWAEARRFTLGAFPRCAQRLTASKVWAEG